MYVLALVASMGIAFALGTRGAALSSLAILSVHMYVVFEPLL